MAMRPRQGRIEVIPQHCAGYRSDPRQSLPSPSGVIPVARAAASPPLEPPGVSDAFQGLSVAPCNSLSVCQRSAISGRLVRPIGIAPACFNWATIGAPEGDFGVAGHVSRHQPAGIPPVPGLFRPAEAPIDRERGHGRRLLVADCLFKGSDSGTPWCARGAVRRRRRGASPPRR